MILLLLLASLGAGQSWGSVGVAHEYVDMIEINHHYDCRGCHVYDQVIFWRQNPATLRFEVGSWILCDEQNKYPTRLSDGLIHCRWRDGQQLRDVRSRVLRESWTQTDPERVNRRQLDEVDRCGLICRPKSQPVEE
jgi:hypothetical protein